MRSCTLDPCLNSNARTAIQGVAPIRPVCSSLLGRAAALIVGVEGVDDVKCTVDLYNVQPFYVPTDDDESVAARAAIQRHEGAADHVADGSQNRGLVVKRAPPGRVVMNKPQVFESSEQVALDLAAPLEAIRVWIIEDAGGAPGASVVTGISFRYRGSDAFVPEAPDAAEDAARRNGNPYVYIEQTATLAKGERVISVKWYSNLQNICRVIAFATNQGRELTFGSNGTLLPDLPPDEASVGGAPLVGMHGFRELTAPQVDIGAFRAGDIDAFHDVTAAQISSRAFCRDRLEAAPVPRPSQSTGQEEQGHAAGSALVARPRRGLRGADRWRKNALPNRALACKDIALRCPFPR